MSKKITIIFLVLFVLTAVLIACGPAAEPTEEMAAPTEAMAEPTEAMPEPTEAMPEPTEAMPEPTAEPTAEPTEEMAPMVDPSGQEVVFWHVWGSGSAAEGMTKIIDEFNANNEWGITVVGFEQGGQSDLQNAVNAAIASGDLPNVTPGFANAISTWYNAGAILPLDDFIADPTYGLSDEELAAIFPSNLALGRTPDGKQIGMPIHQSESVLFYNASWARELGFENPPATSAEFKEQACAAAAFNNSDDNPDNDGTGGFVLYPGASQVADWVFAFGGNYMNEAGDAYDMASPAMKGAASFLKDLHDNGCTFATDSYPNPEFATRLALFTESSTAGVPFQLSAFETAGNDDEWMLIPFPGPDGNLAVNAYGQLIGVMDQNPEANLAAWLWLKYFTSPEVQAEWITYSNYYPSQSTTEQYLTDYIANNPFYGMGLELTQYGVAEPNLASYGAVRGAISDAFFAVLDAPDEAAIDTILQDLNDTAAELLAESQ